MKLTSGLFSSVNTHHTQKEDVTERTTEVSQRKKEASASQVTATFDSAIIQYIPEAVEKAPQENSTPNHRYEISIQEAAICSFYGQISATSDYSNKEFVSTTQVQGYESKTDGKLATEIVLKSYLTENPKADEHNEFGQRDGFAGRPQNKKMKNRHRPEKPTKKFQNQRVKDRHRLGKPAKPLQHTGVAHKYKETVLAHAAINTFSLEKLGGLQ